MIKTRIVLLFSFIIVFFMLINSKLAEAHRTIIHHRSFSYAPWSYDLGYTTNFYGYGNNSYYGYYFNPSNRYYGSSSLLYPYPDPFPYSRYRAPTYYSPLINLPTSPIYIQQSESTIIQENKYWYYCDFPIGYYPNIKVCQTEWIKVPPRLDE